MSNSREKCTYFYFFFISSASETILHFFRITEILYFTGSIWGSGRRDGARGPHLAVADALADSVGLLAVGVVAGGLHRGSTADRAATGRTNGSAGCLGRPPRRAEQTEGRARFQWCSDRSDCCLHYCLEGICSTLFALFHHISCHRRL